MSDIKYANTLVRGDRINISAAIDAALGEIDERFFWDNINDEDDGIIDAVVEGVETRAKCSTVYTDFGAFSVPEDFPLRIVAYAEEH